MRNVPILALDKALKMLEKIGQVTLIKYDNHTSFKDYCRSLVNYWQCLASSGEISFYTLTLLKEILVTSASALNFEGPSDVLLHKWPNGEFKIIAIPGASVIISENTFWLGQYPFLHLSNDYASYDIPYSSAIKLSSAPNNTSPYVIASHNNHYGHFLLDELPLLRRFYGSSRREVTLFPQPLTYGIYNELAAILPLSDVVGSGSPLETEKFFSGPGTCSTLLYENVSVGIVYSTNIFLNAFLSKNLSSVIHAKPNYLLDAKACFLVRRDMYNSRISNLEQILAFCSSKGITLLDPSKYSMRQLEALLRDYSVVIAESGSTTLVASLASSSSTRVISLCPTRLLEAPNAHMVSGGLPYLLSFPNKVRFLKGDSRVYSDVQSSDICFYQTDQLEYILNLYLNC